jgi:AcrR family transcriptional regulator
MSSTTTPVASLRERQKQRARGEIYDAALGLLAEKAYVDVTIEDICARAEVGRATFFRHFGAKIGLLAEFNRRLTDRARADLAQQPAATAIERLRTVQQSLADSWTQAGPAQQELARAFLAEGTVAALDAHGDGAVHGDLLALVTEIVQDGQQSGTLDARLPADFGAWLIVTGIAGATGTWLTQPTRTELDTMTADTLSVILHGLATTEA